QGHHRQTRPPLRSDQNRRNLLSPKRPKNTIPRRRRVTHRVTATQPSRFKRSSPSSVLFSEPTEGCRTSYDVRLRNGLRRKVGSLGRRRSQLCAVRSTLCAALHC